MLVNMSCHLEKKSQDKQTFLHPFEMKTAIQILKLD